MKRAIYKKVGAMTVGMEGADFDAHTPMVKVWDAHNTEHQFEMVRRDLVECETVKVLWTDEQGYIQYDGLRKVG